MEKETMNYRELPRVEKLWGAEYWLTNGIYCMKVLELHHGFQSSLHYHREKQETFYVERGVVVLEIDYNHSALILKKLKLELHEGDFIFIPPNTIHRFYLKPGIENDYGKIIESSTHHDDEDVVRLVESRRL